MYETKEITDLLPLWFNDIGRLCDEAVAFCVFDKVALAYAFDAGKVEVRQLLAVQVLAHERAHGECPGRGLQPVSGRGLSGDRIYLSGKGA
jgi:hypothetical protein